MSFSSTVARSNAHITLHSVQSLMRLRQNKPLQQALPENPTARKTSQLNQAVELMEAYTESTAIPFINTRKQNKLAKRLKNIFSETNLPEPNEEIGKWRTDYNAWREKEKSTAKQADVKKQREDYDALKRIFITLFTISFSAKDFSPLRNKPFGLY